MKLHRLIYYWAVNHAGKRKPDVVIGPESRPYLYRWYVIPRNRWLNIYIHQFLRSDDDRALHDHPWPNLSWILDGRYVEMRPSQRLVKHGTGFPVPVSMKPRFAGNLLFRRAAQAHRIVLYPRSRKLGYSDERRVGTLFITGPKVREWGFLPPHGWVHWENFVHHERREDGTLLSTYAGDNSQVQPKRSS